MRTASAPARPEEAVGILQTWRDAPLPAKALIIGTFVNRFGGFLQFFLVIYMTRRGFSSGQAAFAMGMYGAGSIFGVLVGGWLSDRIGPRRTIVLTMAGTAVLTVSILYLRNYALLVVIVAAVGVSCQAYRPASSSMLSRLVPPARHIMIFSMYRLAVNAATTISPLVAALMIEISWTLLFVTEGITILAYAVIVALALRNVSTPTRKTAGNGARVSYLVILRDRSYLFYLSAIFFTTLIYVQSLSTLPLMVERMYNTFHYSILLALNGFMVVTCGLFVTKQVQKLATRTPILAGVALTGIGMTLFGLPAGYAVLVVGTLVWTTGELIAYPTLLQSYPAQAGPDHLRGRYIGAANSVYNAGMAVGPVIGITIYNHIGSNVWFLSGIVAVIATTLGWVAMTSSAGELETTGGLLSKGNS
ncbi:MAG: MFS transporter [Streptosporangiaceae bacterium]|nr:MFS transporter [Streptosporangiaceae bacterium]